MKQGEALKFYRDEVRRSQRWRDDDHYDALWRRMIDLYRGKHWPDSSGKDQLVVNMAFATKNVIAPSVAVNNPRFTVNARKIEDMERGIMTEEILNYMWRVHKYQPEVRLSVDDWLVCGHGWIKTGYKFVKPPEEKEDPESIDTNAADFGIDDREVVDGTSESEMNVEDDRPYIERISIFDMFVDPDARHPKEMRWIAQRTWRAVQDARVDERYSATARRNINATSYSRFAAPDKADGRDSEERPDQGAIGYCEIIEFYDLKRKTVATFCLTNGDKEGGDLFLIKPRPIPYGFGHPFVMLRNYEVPDHFYPIGELEMIESLQLELDETRTQQLNHRKRYTRKYIYQEDAFDRTGIEALESDVDNTMVPLKAGVPLSDAIIPLKSEMVPSDLYNMSGVLSEDIDRVSGVSDYMRGGQTDIRRTATESAMIQDAANSRAQDKLAKIEDFLAQIAARVVGLMQQFLTGEHSARIVTMPGRMWINYDKDWVQGDFDFEVVAGSTEPRNESFRRQSALQLVDAMAPFVGAGVVDPAAIARKVLQDGFGIKDTSSYITQPGMQPGMEGQPGQPQPGQPGQPQQGQPPMPPQMPPGMPPGQVDMGPPEMDPEMLAALSQLTGSAM